MTKSILLLLFLWVSITHGQVKGSDSNKKMLEFEPRLDLRASSGLSIPLGKYRLLADQSDDRSSAGYGFYTEVSATITPLPTSPWRTGFTVGYMYHPFEVEKSKKEFNLPIFEATSWNSFYAMLGVSILSKKKFCYGLGFDAGVLGYSGGNMRSGQVLEDTMTVQQWDYNLHAAIAIKPSVLLGYHLSPNIGVFVNVSLFYAAGVRYGAYQQERFLVDAQNQLLQPGMEKESYESGSQMTVFSLNLGLMFRYKFYKEPDSFNFQFNINGNK